MVRRINLLMDDYYRTIYLAIPQESRQQVMESLRILNQVLENNKCC
jgi:hypothetical protein